MILFEVSNAVMVLFLPIILLLTGHSHLKNLSFKEDYFKAYEAVSGYRNRERVRKKEQEIIFLLFK